MIPVREPTEHERWMRECLRLAAKGEGKVSPNPMVGAVLVKDSQVIARGYHARFGAAHAEARCLAGISSVPADAVLYVNLEPCAHHGKTPPCTDLIIRSGVRNVVVGMVDPNPLVAGSGIAALRRAGIAVTTGICTPECREANEFFLKHITTGIPFVHVKIAQTLDGIIGSHRTRRLVITSAASQKMVHRWRASHDAVLVGAGTIIADDPLLTVRLTRGRDPHVVILDGRLRIPVNSRVLRRNSSRKIIICTTRAAVRRSPGIVQTLERTGARVLALPGNLNRIHLRTVLKALYRLNIGSVLVEGGATVFAQALSSGLTDQCSVFVAPRILRRGVPVAGRTGRGHLRLCPPVSSVTTSVLDHDVLIQYRTEYGG